MERYIAQLPGKRKLHAHGFPCECISSSYWAGGPPEITSPKAKPSPWPIVFHPPGASPGPGMHASGSIVMSSCG